MEHTLFNQGLDLMFFGMGTVFVFLTLLVFATMLMSYVVQNYFVELDTEVNAARPSSPARSGAVDSKTLKIIQDAVQQHRAKKR